MGKIDGLILRLEVDFTFVLSLSPFPSLSFLPPSLHAAQC